MKALTEKEVRIGNYAYGLFEDENGKPARNIVSFLAVDSTSSLCDGWWAIAERIDGTETEEYDDFEAIPLTEEWLIKFGCQKSGSNDRYFLNHHGFCLSFDDLDWCLHQNPDTIVVISYCRYVHQLQNLFYALTGEELTIKETVPA